MQRSPTIAGPGSRNPHDRQEAASHQRKVPLYNLLQHDECAQRPWKTESGDLSGINKEFQLEYIGIYRFSIGTYRDI